MSKMKVNRIENTATTAGGLDINSSGRVGIGTTSPDAELDVNGRIYLAEGNELAWHNGAGAQAARIYGSATDELRFDIGSTASRALTIDSSGRLLVGTSSASLANKFLLQGDTSSANNGGYMRLQTNNSVVAGTSLGSIGFGDSANNGALIEARGDVSWSPFTKGSRLEFSTTADGASSPTERMRINSEGQFKTLTTSTSGHSIVTTQGASSSINLFLGIRSATNVNDGTAVYVVYSNGTYATLSDETQKKNIESARSGYLEDLKQLRVVKYNWKDQDDSEPKELGLIAQEVEQVFPGLVSEIQAESGEVNKGVKAGVLPYMLLKALQEATSRIETLEAVVTALQQS